ncbi:MAG: glycosyltransferase family 4 protein [Butyrivibrio sp.]|jgi:glycosyltransferase involved in cell wall biosynthesis|nr:glycosyltransferase family 4 protein [Butyrivibrio sp.]
MRILYVADTYEIGGAFLAFIDLVGDILEKHQDITPIILASKQGKNNGFADKHGVENYSIGHKAYYMNNGSTLPRKIIRFVLRPVLKIRYELANRKAVKKAENLIDFKTIDLIHSNSNRNDIGAILAQKYGIPHIWHLREYGEECFTLRKNYIDYMNNHADCFIAISHAVADRWIEKGLDRDKIIVIYDGVGCVPEKSQKLNDRIVKGVIAGFVSPFKGQFDLIKSLELIKNDIRHKFQLDIYGNVALEYLMRLKLYVAMHRMGDIVKFKGYVEGVEKLYSDYDIGFMCSKAEGFGRVTVEYMMSNLCVIASDTGANQEIIEDGINGYLYKYKDRIDLAMKVKNVILDPSRATICANRGMEDAKRKYTKEINADNICKLYYKVLKKRAKNEFE